MPTTTTTDREGRVAGPYEATGGRDADLGGLYRELVEEAGRALEAGEDAWCVMLQEALIPSVEREGLRALAALGSAGIPTTPGARAT